MSCVIVWFRRDLRVTDNPALDYALSLDKPVIPIYVHDPESEQEWSPGSASRWWCHYSLKKLAESLDKMGLGLHFFKGKPEKIIQRLVSETGASNFCFNRRYEPDEINLETEVTKLLRDVSVKAFHSQLLFSPGSIVNNQEKPYRVFTPFWKKARVDLESSIQIPSGTKKPKAKQIWKAGLNNECKLEKLGLLDSHTWHQKFHSYWTPGELSAQKKLDNFIKHHLYGYDLNRDYPALEGTSKLSAHLHFGEISPSQIIYRLRSIKFSKDSAKHIERFITELGWREFAYHIMWHFPETRNQPMNAKFSELWPAAANPDHLKAWQMGNTGIPLIDAGMRELYETGWMHNRVRMIVASFLTKNLGIHWLHGAKWFWDTLVDADLANNTMGWQWVAGCGVDAAPFYRIFNPDTQASKFDKDNEYIFRWAPEANKNRLPAIVDLKISRELALKRYKEYS